MRQNEVGDRREHDRFPTDLKVRVRSGGREAVTGTVDVGLGGVLLKPTAGLVPAPGAPLDIDVAAVGTVPAEVVKVSPMGVHCRLRSPSPDIHGRFARLVAEVEEGYRPLIKVAQDGARRVAMAIEGAVAAGRLTREAVFDAEYRPIPGTDPQQYETGYLRAFEDLLPEIQEPLLISDNSMVFCIAVDRNGYVPVHNRRFSQPQRRGETAWNTANARNRRIFDDRAGIAAARSTRPFLVQAYNRDMGGGMMVMMREVDAPIRVFGRHWGGFRTAYRL
jgi:methyl-accepting chemotaxis protein